jgi:putative RecB family exonuclease
MVYQISATKLQSYSRCPYAYYLRYELRMNNSEFFGSAALGTALHQALAQCHRDWHYLNAVPDLKWVHHCWDQQTEGLSSSQTIEGKEILENYYHNFIANEVSLSRPLAVEGRIQGFLQVKNLEFCITGRYDRLDFLEDGYLEVIDYKSSREVKVPSPQDVDIQIGLYYFALEQTYHQNLKYLSLLFLRSGEKVQFEATPEHKQQVEEVISKLAVQLRYDRDWQATPGEQCDRCAYSRYCPAVTANPTPLPASNVSARQLQLTLSLN